MEEKMFNQPPEPFGITGGISIADYHTMPGLSKSNLDKLAISPAHYQAALRGEFSQTPDMKIGSAVHKMVLEPEDFDLTYAVLDEDIDRRTKAGKQAYADFIALHGTKEVISRHDYLLTQQISHSVRTHATASKLLTGGTAEQSCFWVDDDTGVACKCRPDWLRDDGVVIDLKTTQDASPAGFARACAKYNYHVQAAFYLDGLTAVGIEANHFVFVAVEKLPPFAVGVYTLDSAALQAGRAAYQELLELYKTCADACEWPAYQDSVIELSLPIWALNK